MNKTLAINHQNRKADDMTTAWTTKNELDFIKGLGKWSKDSAAVKERTRGELLALYLAGASKRDNWDGIDRDKVVAYARECIVNEVAN